MKRSDNYNQHGEGEREIDWLSDEDRKLLDHFDAVHSLSGMWRNKRARFWIWFWTIVQIAWTVVYLYSIPFLIVRLDLFAHVIHHTVVGVDDLMYVDLLSKKKHYLKSVAEGLTQTYNYNSQTLKNYHRKLMTDRLKNQDSKMFKLSTACAIFLFLYLEVFYILEATIFKNYVTMFPIHLPIDINHPVTYTCVVIMQKLTIYISMLMVMGISCLIYSAYCHLALEFDVLVYAIKHIDDLVTERLVENKCQTKAETEQALAQLYNFYCYHFARHHGCIRRYFHNVKKACEVVIFSVIFTGLICFACVGITSLSDNVGVKLKFVMVMMVQMVVIYGFCWIGEEITSKDEELRSMIACLPWWLMPKKCHSTIVLMLLGCQIPMQLTTPFNQVSNRKGFKDLTSSSYSCFSLMYQMNFSN